MKTLYLTSTGRQRVTTMIYKTRECQDISIYNSIQLLITNLTECLVVIIHSKWLEINEKYIVYHIMYINLH